VISRAVASNPCQGHRVAKLVERPVILDERTATVTQISSTCKVKDGVDVDVYVPVS
jgi:hypothetical protein